MIFDEATLQKIAEAMERGDLGYLRALTRKKPPRRRPLGRVHTALMVSGINPRHLNRLDELSADIAIINLEDGVAPEKKEIALAAARLFLSHLPGDAPVYAVVRVNPLDERGRAEIEALRDVGPDAVRIPKVRSQSEIDEAKALAGDGIKIHISVETPEAHQDLARFGGVEACYLGILDLFAALSIPQKILKIANPTVDHILAKFLIDARTIGALPVSFVYQDYKNLEEFRDWCRYERSMGYSAKGCISPDQVEAARAIFAPSKAEIERARYIKERFEEMAAKGITGFADERYGFIDEPIYKDALQILKDQ